MFLVSRNYNIIINYCFAKSLKSKKKRLALTFFYYFSREIWLGNSKKLICIDQSRFYIFSWSVIKKLTDSTKSTTSEQTDTASGQTSTTSGQTITTSGITSTASWKTNTSSGRRVLQVIRQVIPQLTIASFTGFQKYICYWS